MIDLFGSDIQLSHTFVIENEDFRSIFYVFRGICIENRGDIYIY